MIIEEILNEHRVLHYSDQNLHIRQLETGNIYESAEDNIPCIYTYEETDIPIPDYVESEQEEITNG